ncbi:glycosyltransferase [Roseospira visakhapatnamensis]|uniref:Uncharacterized protein n=1 Tax=Roseospira visakhapatnamensis TaxID=390880 RepID=A0A7W6RCF8_9PROT|nr:glycosyltransferase [Roseospira visakhapatnamensis]MBB4265930.1 hypothetical protein [Roseospira visakhapatnamensis]
MRILFADDGVPYDGRTPVEDPLGGGERAVVGLARALAARGHRVSVATQIIDPASVDGVGWLPLPVDAQDDSLPETVDVLVAVRRPSLLRLPVRPGRKALWVLGDPTSLTRPAVRARLLHHRPDLLFVSESQRRAWPGTGGLTAHVLTPGAAAPFLAADPDPDPPAVAVSTVHPAHGLDWLLDRWEAGIAPAAPDAHLHLYSVLLTAGLNGQPVPADIAHRVDRVRALADAGVSVLAPGPDAALADAWRRARVFLHPGSSGDHACWSLVEAQAAGLPAVARSLGGAAERLVDGETGHLAPDDAAFENLAAMLLTQPGVAANLSTGARDPARRRPWVDVARDLEAHWLRFGR